MSQELVYIELETVTARGTSYRGQFVLKKFLNQRDRNEVARIANKLSVGLRRSPSYSLAAIYELASASVKNSLSKVMQDSKVMDKYSESLNADRIAAGVLDAILPEFSNQDSRAEEMYYLALLNVHIVEFPEWWKPKGETEGGMLLEDYEPIAELYIKLMEAQRPVQEKKD